MYQEDFHLSHYQQFPPKLLTQHSVRETLWNFIGHSVLLGESFHRTKLLSVWLWVYIIYKVFETTLDNSVRLEMRQIGLFTYLSCRSDGPMNLADTGNTQKTRGVTIYRYINISQYMKNYIVSQYEIRIAIYRDFSFFYLNCLGQTKKYVRFRSPDRP